MCTSTSSMFSLSSFVNGVPPPSRQEAREKKRKRRSSPSNNDRDEKEKDDESEKESERRSSFLPSDAFVRNVLDVVGFVVVVVDGALRIPQVVVASAAAVVAVAVVTAMALPMKDIHFIIIPSPLPLLGGFIRRRPAEIIFTDDISSLFFSAEGEGESRARKVKKEKDLRCFQKSKNAQTRKEAEHKLNDRS